MVDIESAAGDTIPGGGPDDRMGLVIAVPFPATAADLVLVGGDCMLMGWSICEGTGFSAAAVELYDGGNAAAALLASLPLTPNADPTASQTNLVQTTTTANAAAVATLNGIPTLTTFVTGVEILGLGATAGSTQDATLTGCLGGTIHIPIVVPAGVGTPITPVQLEFSGKGLPSAAAGGNIVLTVPAFGAGNTQEQATIHGYAQGGAGASSNQWLGDSGIYVRSGLFMHILFGTVKGTVFVRL